MLPVIAVDRTDGLRDFVQMSERKYAAVSTKHLREAGFLGNNWTAGGQITRAPVAKPAGIQPNVLIFCDGKLAFRLTNVIAITPVVHTEIMRNAKTPSIPQEPPAGFDICNIRRQFEYFACDRWCFDKSQEFSGLAP